MPAPAALPVHADVPPADITAANDHLGDLRVIRSEVARIQAELDATVAQLVATAQAKASRAVEQIPALEAALNDFADTYRPQLATGRGKTQTIKLPNGDLVWKDSILSITVDNETVALADIERRGWILRFTEEKRFIVKDKLKETDESLRDARRIKGVTVNDPTGVFAIKPAEIKLKADTRLKTDGSDRGDSGARTVEVE